MTDDKHFRFNLLSYAPVRAIVRWRFFPYAIQAALLILFAVLVGVGWGIGRASDEMSYLKILRKTNLTTLLIWGIWWPGMIFGAIFLGRFWCIICPIELVNNLAHRAAGALGLRGLRLPRWVTAGYVILLIYLTMQVLVGVFAIHRIPSYTAYMLVALPAVAVLSGLAFREPRSFCKGFCPANLLLSVYGRHTPLQLDTADPSVCKSCSTKDCISKKRERLWDGRSCPSGVPAFDRRQGDACVLCFQCAKACPKENVGYGLARPEAPSRRRPILTLPEALFIVCVSGFITHEVFTEIKPLEWLFHCVVNAVNTRTAGVLPYSVIHTAWYLLVFPAGLWLLVVAAVRLAGGGGMKRALLLSATAAAPAVAAAHLAKATAKLNSWVTYLPTALSHPVGVSAAKAIHEGAARAPGHLVEFKFIAILAVVLGSGAAVFAWRQARRMLDPEDISRGRLAVAIVASMYIAVLLAWPFAHY